MERAQGGRNGIEGLLKDERKQDMSVPIDVHSKSKSKRIQFEKQKKMKFGPSLFYLRDRFLPGRWWGRTREKWHSFPIRWRQGPVIGGNFYVSFSDFLERHGYILGMRYGYWYLHVTQLYESRCN